MSASLFSHKSYFLTNMLINSAAMSKGMDFVLGVMAIDKTLDEALAMRS